LQPNFSHDLSVFVFNKQKDMPLSSASVKVVVKEVLFFIKKKTNEVSIYFVTSKKITALHAYFFDDPTPTDCISLPLDDAEEKNYHILGEIFISPKAALNYSPQNPYEEITLYLVHGLLHLMGYDDCEPAQRKKMRLAERKIMHHLKRKKLLVEKKSLPPSKSQL
jgi:probable rRNA maturation factor